jgi:hypothetical protein
MVCAFTPPEECLKGLSRKIGGEVCLFREHLNHLSVDLLASEYMVESASRRVAIQIIVTCSDDEDLLTRVRFVTRI